ADLDLVTREPAAFVFAVIERPVAVDVNLRARSISHHGVNDPVGWIHHTKRLRVSDLACLDLQLAGITPAARHLDVDLRAGARLEAQSSDEVVDRDAVTRQRAAFGLCPRGDYDAR